MEYISANETAKMWGVTPRQVQRLVALGRIPDAKKCGSLWIIPADAQKPGVPRLKKQYTQESLPSELAKIIEATTLPMPLNNPDAILHTVKERRLRLQYEGELAYLRGDFERTKSCFRKTEGDGASRLRACSVAIAAAISMGDYPFYLEIESHLHGVISKSNDKSVIAFAELCLANAYLSAAAPQMAPGWLKNGDFTNLHSKAKPDAIYKRVKYFQFTGKPESMLAIAETALSIFELSRGISFSDIYLRVTCATACCFLGQIDEAMRWLLEAMRIALPHGFITPFAESASVFGGLLEKLLEQEYPAYYDVTINQWKRTFVNWSSFHNFFTKDNIISTLSLRDYEIALMAANRVPNKKIAEHFHMSEGRLRNKISEIYKELLVNNRKELEYLVLYGKKT